LIQDLAGFANLLLCFHHDQEGTGTQAPK